METIDNILENLKDSINSEIFCAMRLLEMDIHTLSYRSMLDVARLQEILSGYKSPTLEELVKISSALSLHVNITLKEE